MSHYDTLGVQKDATVEEIKRAYRKVALDNHPDRHPGDEDASARFRAAATAYEVLSNEDTRRAYDRGFRPVNSVAELFNTNLGRTFVSAMLPSAPAAPKDGLDIIEVVEVSADTITHGGVVEITNPRDPSQTISLRVVADYRWCRLPSLGKSGRNGGQTGVLYIHLIPTLENTDAKHYL